MNVQFESLQITTEKKPYKFWLTELIYFMDDYYWSTTGFLLLLLELYDVSLSLTPPLAFGAYLFLLSVHTFIEKDLRHTCIF